LLGEEYNQKNKKWKHGYVYVLDYGDGETFKIGSTIHEPEKRLNQICSGTVIMPMHLVMAFEIYTNCEMVEQLIHMNWDDYHVRGEWFKSDWPAILQLYDMMLKWDCYPAVFDRWYDIVPEDYEEYTSLKNRTKGSPYFTREEAEEGEKLFLEVSKMWSDQI
jgi:hypothetical protein